MSPGNRLQAGNAGLSGWILASHSLSFHLSPHPLRSCATSDYLCVKLMASHIYRRNCGKCHCGLGVLLVSPHFSTLMQMPCLFPAHIKVLLSLDVKSTFYMAQWFYYWWKHPITFSHQAISRREIHYVKRDKVKVYYIINQW